MISCFQVLSLVASSILRQCSRSSVVMIWSSSRLLSDMADYKFSSSAVNLCEYSDELGTWRLEQNIDFQICVFQTWYSGSFAENPFQMRPILRLVTLPRNFSIAGENPNTLPLWCPWLVSSFRFDIWNKFKKKNETNVERAQRVRSSAKATALTHSPVSQGELLKHAT